MYDARVTYRDTFERCPRCGVELVAAGNLRACEGCGGAWVDEPTLTEMLVDMRPPGAFATEELATMYAAPRSDAPLGCPGCGERMQMVQLHDVPVDRCPKGHGVWFDRAELADALRRAGLSVTLEE